MIAFMIELKSLINLLEVNQLMKTPHIMNGVRNQTIKYSLNFAWIHLYVILSHQIPKKHYVVREETTFLEISIQLLPFKNGKNLLKMLQVFGLTFVINQNIIKYTHTTHSYNLIKILGAFKKNNITIHSYNPSLVLNVVFHSSHECILIWW